MTYNQLSLDLIEAQYMLRENSKNYKSKGVIILIGGIELSRKGQSIKKLNDLMDPRFIKVKSEIPHKINKNKYMFQPYISDIPKQGEITILYGNWYTDLLTSTLYGDEKISDSLFKEYLKTISIFENYLKNNNIEIIKVWFDLDWDTIKRRIKNINLSTKIQRVPNFQWDNFPIENWKTIDLYNNIKKLSSLFINDWNIINHNKNKDRNLAFSKLVLDQLNIPILQREINKKFTPLKINSLLTDIPNTIVDKDQYKIYVKKLEKKVAEALRYSSKNIIFVFEGMDAGGKGSAIKRVVKYLDPHEYNIHRISAPENYERKRPYLWRFWNKSSTNGAISIFDRSWYGRVLVERVEQLTLKSDWTHSYDEINQYEKQLSECNTLVIKFWFAISKDEQLNRFESRQNTPQKQFKLTDEDWRNREKWDDYLQAASDMLKYTNTHHSPWHIIANDNKHVARIEMLQTILRSLKHA